MGSRSKAKKNYTFRTNEIKPVKRVMRGRFRRLCPCSQSTVNGDQHMLEVLHSGFLAFQFEQGLQLRSHKLWIQLSVLTNEHLLHINQS